MKRSKSGENDFSPQAVCLGAFLSAFRYLHLACSLEALFDSETGQRKVRRDPLHFSKAGIRGDFSGDEGSNSEFNKKIYGFTQTLHSGGDGFYVGLSIL